jgi:hypothetical protein
MTNKMRRRRGIQRIKDCPCRYTGKLRIHKQVLGGREELLDK